MALETVPYALQSASHGAELFRRALQSMLAGGGVISSGDLAVTANGTPNMTVNVAAGQVWIPGTLGASTGMPPAFTSQGAYYGLSNATTNLTISAADPTNPRIDLIVASVQDSFYSGASNQAVLQVVTGTPAASPSAPATPAGSVVLAQVAVAANASSITSASITDKRPYLHLVGYGDTGWTAAALTGGWVASGTPAPAFRKIGTTVWLRGAIQSGALSSAALTLPAGYAPAAGPLLFSCYGSSATFSAVQVGTGGTVTPIAGPTAGIWLDNIRFDTV